MDWAWALLATELAFASEVVGSGYEWSTTTGWSDDTTVKVLRSTQLKLIRTVSPLVGRGLGTGPEGRPERGSELGPWAHAPAAARLSACRTGGESHGQERGTMKARTAVMTATTAALCLAAVSCGPSGGDSPLPAHCRPAPARCSPRRS